MKNWIFNLETTKIELHFDKSEYDALSDPQRTLLKSNFLWSRMGKCWVSRSKEPNLYRAKAAARELGFTEEVRQGERLSYGEQVGRQAERAEDRADRYEDYAANATGRAEQLQSDFAAHHGDIAFFTQPNINSSAGRAFTNYRDRVYARYERGFDEYRKSEYFLSKAAAARDNASSEKFKDKGYLDRRIKECEKEIRARQKNIVGYEQILFALDSGEEKSKWNGEPYTVEETTAWIERELELIEVAMDKQGYLLNCLDALGGIAFSKDNIEVGYLVEVKRWGTVEVVGTGPKNISFKILTGGAAGFGGTVSYAEIIKIIKADKREIERHPFVVGERFSVRRVSFDDPNSMKPTTTMVEYEIVKRSDTTIQLKELGANSKPITRKPRKPGNGQWMFSFDDRHENTFYKTEEEA